MMNNQKSDIPRHIVVFPDGNRRWAKEQGFDTLEGHKAGYENLLKFREWCQARGVQALTAFGFSTENWNRTEREVSYLMRLLESGLAGHFKRYMQEAALQEQGVRVRVIGQKARLPESLQKVIAEVEEGTKDNTKFFLNLGISYGGRWDIAQATRRIIKDGIAPEQVTEDLFASYLSTAGLPEPDLVIRAGGEHRFSNFVLWQGVCRTLFRPKILARLYRTRF